MIEFIVLNKVSRHVVDVMVRFDGSDGCRIARHHCGRISRNRDLGVNRSRDYCGRQRCHRRKFQLPLRRFSVRRTVECHRFCHFIENVRQGTSHHQEIRPDVSSIRSSSCLPLALLVVRFLANLSRRGCNRHRKGRAEVARRWVDVSRIYKPHIFTYVYASICTYTCSRLHTPFHSKRDFTLKIKRWRVDSTRSSRSFATMPGYHVESMTITRSISLSISFFCIVKSFAISSLTYLSVASCQCRVEKVDEPRWKSLRSKCASCVFTRASFSLLYRSPFPHSHSDSS